MYSSPRPPFSISYRRGRASVLTLNNGKQLYAIPAFPLVATAERGIKGVST